MRQIILSWLYFLANCIKDGSIIPPRSLKTRWRVDSAQKSLHSNQTINKLKKTQEFKINHKTKCANRIQMTGFNSVWKKLKKEYILTILLKNNVKPHVSLKPRGQWSIYQIIHTHTQWILNPLTDPSAICYGRTATPNEL